MSDKGKIIIVMGVSGSGKSTIGQLLAQELNLVFLDADDYHPPENIEKMKDGRPLNDQDRKGWLSSLNTEIRKFEDRGLVLACSALKESYRRHLGTAVTKDIQWVYLDGQFEEILNRMRKRKGHFMPATLLKSQFDTLEVPPYALKVKIEESPQKMLAKIAKTLK